jgi:hypothetical protein
MYGISARNIFHTKNTNVTLEVYCTRKATNVTQSIVVSEKIRRIGRRFVSFRRVMMPNIDQEFIFLFTEKAR